MKKPFLFLFSFLLFIGARAQIGDTGTLRYAINTFIAPNGTRAITGQILNNILNGQLNLTTAILKGGVSNNNNHTVTWLGQTYALNSNITLPVPTLEDLRTNQIDGVYNGDYLTTDEEGKVILSHIPTFYNEDGSIYENRLISFNAGNNPSYIQMVNANGGGFFQVNSRSSSYSNSTDNSSLAVSHTGAELNNYISNGIAFVLAEGGEVKLSSYNTASSLTRRLTISAFQRSRYEAGDNTPLDYAGDYSANYTLRSLIDKGYLDARLAGFSGGSNWSSITNKPAVLDEITQADIDNARDVPNLKTGKADKEAFEDSVRNLKQSISDIQAGANNVLDTVRAGSTDLVRSDGIYKAISKYVKNILLEGSGRKKTLAFYGGDSSVINSVDFEAPNLDSLTGVIYDSVHRYINGMNLGSGGGGSTEAVIGEQLIGTADGATTSFMFSTPPALNSYVIYVNGQRMSRGISYTVSGSTATFLAPPTPGALIVSDYSKIVLANEVYEETPAGSMDGINNTFTLEHSPKPNTEAVYLNGLRLSRSSYTISNDIITYSFTVKPGNDLKIQYKY